VKKRIMQALAAALVMGTLLLAAAAPAIPPGPKGVVALPTPTLVAK
jgi:hypothetical protein